MRHTEEEINKTPDTVVANCVGRHNEVFDVIHPIDGPTTKDGAVYHATETYLGEKYTLDEGGRYEKVVDGSLVYKSEREIRAELNDTLQISASKTPEACVIARVDNENKDLGDPLRTSPRVSIYEITRSPDVDLSKCPDRDFELLEEVRFNNPSKNPIQATHHMTVVFPGRLARDIFQVYNPDVDVFVSETPKSENNDWHSNTVGHAVKQSIRAYLQSGEFPNPEEHICLDA